jgi:hypothetical protein
MGQSTPIRKRAATDDLALDARSQTELARWYRVRCLPDPNAPRESWECTLLQREADMAVKH